MPHASGRGGPRSLGSSPSCRDPEERAPIRVRVVREGGAAFRRPETGRPDLPAASSATKYYRTVPEYVVESQYFLDG